MGGRLCPILLMPKNACAQPWNPSAEGRTQRVWCWSFGARIRQTHLDPVVVPTRPSGTYTRTMSLDITDRVLMEREKGRLEGAEHLSAGGNSRRARFYGNCRQQPAAPDGAQPNRADRAGPTQRSLSWARLGQERIDCPRDSRSQPARAVSPGESELRRHQRRTGGKRVVRSCAGRVHRGADKSRRTLQTCGRRHHLPG